MRAVTMSRRVGEPMGWGFRLAAAVVVPASVVLTRREWECGERIPRSGGAVVAANHVSHADPLTFAHFVYGQGRLPRFLAKAELFEVRFIGAVLRSMGQIPVFRLTTDAALAFRAAVDAVRSGKIIIVYPEGTLTRQPELWPMAGKTGAARIALTADVPVIPVAQWGAHEILYPYAARPSLWPRKQVRARAGAPVDLDDLRGRPLTPEVLAEATDRIMDAITALLEELRGEPAPTDRFDPRRAGVRPIGNPNLDLYEERAGSRRRRMKSRRSP
jgi:1-acyl-sn-glycerol-3-phosphate acyltransferase